MPKKRAKYTEESLNYLSPIKYRKRLGLAC